MSLHNNIVFNPEPAPRHSPWGEVQERTPHGVGIWWVSTASHGGF
ncbi:MAG: DUF7007 domain-containing protein, partial [Steroidobacteraceae bacterium]